MTGLDLTRLWTTTQAAEHCGIKPVTWRANASRKPETMPRPVGRHPDTGEKLYEPEEVRAWHASRPGARTRTDLLADELAPLALRIAADAPNPRAHRIDRHDLADGIVVLANWHRPEEFPSGQADVVEVERLDSVQAVAPTRLWHLAEPGDDDYDDPDRLGWTGERRWAFRVDLRDPEALLPTLVRVVAAARRDHADDLATAAAHEQARRDALAQLADAAQRVATAHATPGRPGYLEALEHRRWVVRRLRDGDGPGRRVLSLDEISNAAGMTRDEVERA